MKKNLIKKMFAVSLSIAMGCSLLPAANPVTASAAAPYVSLNTAFKTLKVGQKYKLTLKNNSLNWKITKAESTDKAVASVYRVQAKSLKIKPKSEGRTTVRVSLKTNARKNKNTKTLKCRVKVVSTTTPTPDVPTPDVKTEATVTTQAQLDEALATSSITKITIKPTDGTNFTIPKASYSTVALIVDAPDSDIENSATFQSITIENIKAETWTELGEGNSFTVTAPKSSIKVGKDAKVKNITIAKKDIVFNLNVDGGAVEGVTVNEKSEVNITGTSAEDAALIPVTVNAGAGDAVVKSAIRVALSLNAKVTVEFTKGAEGSTIKVEVAGLTFKLSNKTDKEIIVTNSDNTTQKVIAGQEKDITQPATPVTPGTSNPGSTTNPSYNLGAAASKIVTSGAISLKNIKANIQTASALVVSNGAISFDIEGVKVTTPAAVEFMVTLKDTTSSSTSTLVLWTDMTEVKDSQGKVVGYKASVGNANINGVHPSFELVISVRVKRTATTNAGAVVQTNDIEVTVPNTKTEGFVATENPSIDIAYKN